MKKQKTKTRNKDYKMKRLKMKKIPQKGKTRNRLEKENTRK